MGKEDRVCHKIIDVAVPADCRVNAKGAMRKVEVILVVVGALQFGGNLNRSRQHAEKTALLGTARMAVFTLGTDYPSETGYPLDNSCQTYYTSYFEKGMVLILVGQSA